MPHQAREALPILCVNVVFRGERSPRSVGVDSVRHVPRSGTQRNWTTYAANNRVSQLHAPQACPVTWSAGCASGVVPVESFLGHVVCMFLFRVVCFVLFLGGVGVGSIELAATIWLGVLLCKRCPYVVDVMVAESLCTLVKGGL